MENMSFIKTGANGQIVIPARMRERLVEGKEFVIVNNDQSFVLKANPLNEKMKEDLEFARRTEEALQRIKAGKGITMEFDEFIEEMKKW